MLRNPKFLGIPKKIFRLVYIELIKKCNQAFVFIDLKDRRWHTGMKMKTVQVNDKQRSVMLNFFFRGGLGWGN